jgi:diguanylate cyclase (GGDEF)-like protein
VTFALPRFRTLRTRLTVLYSTFFSVGLIALAVLAQVMIERSARASATDELITSATVYDRLWHERERSLAGAVDVVAKDFGFRAAVAGSDVATIESALDSLRTRAGVPFAVLVTSEGAVIGSAGALGARIGALDTGGGTRRGTVVAVGSRVYRIVSAPVLAPFEIGRISFILPLDQQEMGGLERLFAIPLNATILTRVGYRGWSNGAVTIPSGGRGTVRTVDGPTGRAFAMLRPLAGPYGEPQAALLLSYPITRAMSSYRTIQYGLVAAGLAWLVLVVVGSRRLARGIARPIAALDAAARLLEEGERTEVSVDSNDEVGRLASSFNRMSREIKEREERITHLAFHDGLTGLPNRVFFHQSLEQALARVGRRVDEHIGVLCLDLDGFKAINDTLGHATGDALLREVAAQLLRLGDGAMVARLGGDEFAIVLPEAGDLGRSRRLAQAIINAFAEPTDVAGHTVAIGVSIGIAIYPTDGRNAATLVKNADLALYRAKRDGRGGFRFFEQSLDEAARRRRQIETDLRIAIRTGQLELYFQPIVASETEVITGFEALLRWPHPDRGLVSPVEFIPVAEETGLIVPLGEWVLHEACHVAMTWPAHIRVAVNVSPLQFRSPGFGAVVLQALSRSGLAPERLEIEITESVFLEGETSVLQILHMLRNMGVRVALDDFGTGYSSLSYLRSFPFDKIKIDRSFIINVAGDESAAAIVKAIVDLAKALDMETTAEGVEDTEQLAELRAQGCTTLQGYLFSRPLSVVAAADLIGDSRRSDRTA